MPVSKQFDPAEFRRTLGRMAEGSDFGQTNPMPAFDPILDAAVAKECIHGRRIEDFGKALESQGFVFVPPSKLPLWHNGLPRTEGEYRCVKLKMSLTERDILSMFDSPQTFWEWVESRKNIRKVRASGQKKILSQVPR